jgi:hypothetical protein
MSQGFTIGAWSPGIGDPTFMGWLTVFSYYLAAAVCLLRLFFQRRDQLFWAILMVGMAALGVIKQFNLLGAVTEMGRAFVRSGGWAGERRFIQACVMAAVFAVFFFVVMIVRALGMPTLMRYSAAASGFAYLLLFVVLRAISWHPFDAVLSCEIWGARINWIAELLGICWVLAASVPRAAKSSPPGI